MRVSDPESHSIFDSHSLERSTVCMGRGSEAVGILGKGKGGGGGAYPRNQGVGSLGTIGGHDGTEVLMYQGPYQYYAIPVAQGHCYQQLQTHLQQQVHHDSSGKEAIFLVSY